LTVGVAVNAAESATKKRVTVQSSSSDQEPARRLHSVIIKDSDEADPAEPVAWLGVAVGKVTPVVASQLGLPKGVGLVVDHVAEDGPAAKAGLQANDILVQFDNQTLINPEQLTVLVRSREVGDRVKLTCRQKGEKRVVEVELVSRPAHAAGVGLGDVIDVDTDALKTLINQQAHRAYTVVQDELPKIRDVIRSTIVNLTDQKTVLKDDQGTLTVTRKDGRRYLTAEDKDGEVIFDGPIETEEQLGEVPKRIRKRLDSLPTTPGLELDDLKQSLDEVRRELKDELEALGRQLEQLKGTLSKTPASDRP
jgi:hypothetical protein